MVYTVGLYGMLKQFEFVAKTQFISYCYPNLKCFSTKKEDIIEWKIYISQKNLSEYNEVVAVVHNEVVAVVHNA